MTKISQKYLIFSFNQLGLTEEKDSNLFDVLLYEEQPLIHNNVFLPVEKTTQSVDEFLNNHVFDKGWVALSHLEEIKDLLCGKTNENFLSVLFEKIPENYINASIYLKEECQPTALMLACSLGLTNLIVKLLKQGANPNIQAANYDCALNLYFKNPNFKHISENEHFQVLTLMQEKGANFNHCDKDCHSVFENFLSTAFLYPDYAQKTFDFLLDSINVNAQTQAPNERNDALTALFKLSYDPFLLTRENIDKIFDAGYQINYQHIYVGNKRNHVLQDNFISSCASHIEFDESLKGEYYPKELYYKQEMFEYVYDKYPFNMDILDMEDLCLLELSVRQQNFYIMKFILEHTAFEPSFLFKTLMFYEYQKGIEFAIDEQLFDYSDIAPWHDMIENVENESIKKLLQKQWLDVSLPKNDTYKKHKI